MANTNISINYVLSELRAGKKCSLLYVRSTGKKKRGSLKKIDNAIEGWHYQSFKYKSALALIKANNKSQIKENSLKGLIPIIDLDSGEQNTLLISHIIGYNGLTVIH